MTIAVDLGRKATKHVCHYCHNTVPEFILILYDVDENHMSVFTDVKKARTLCQLRAF